MIVAMASGLRPGFTSTKNLAALSLATPFSVMASLTSTEKLLTAGGS